MPRLSVNGVELEYTIVGSGEPLVLIHGAVSGDTNDCLVGEQTLTSRYRVINYHRRCFLGSSHGVPCGTALEAVDAAAIVRELAGGRAHVAGHSAGGAIAIELAAQFPEVVHTLALLEPPLPVPSFEAMMARLGAAAELYASGDAGAAVDAVLAAVLGPGEYRDAVAPHLPEGWRQRAIADSDRLFGADMEDAWECTKEMASQIHVPVLSVLGELSDRFFVEGDALIHEWIPQAETFVLPNASHGLQYMNPRGMAEGLIAFLEKHPMRVPVTA